MRVGRASWILNDRQPGHRDSRCRMSPVRLTKHRTHTHVVLDCTTRAVPQHTITVVWMVRRNCVYVRKSWRDFNSAKASPQLRGSDKPLPKTLQQSLFRASHNTIAWDFAWQKRPTSKRTRIHTLVNGANVVHAGTRSFQVLCPNSCANGCRVQCVCGWRRLPVDVRR